MTPLHKAYVILVLAIFQLVGVFWILRPIKRGTDDRRARTDRNLAIAMTVVTVAIVSLLLEK